ncbi:MAG: PstS family phosphate ABC transporter substrate-binding protein [Solirubrobacteraceae bacterium]|nr:PstS family phosphate ABC transporter substrate-binding protein [Solirubrobacteraceae bacterium]
MTPNRLIAALAVTGSLAFGLAACGDDEKDSAGSGTESTLSGTISIDGSSTVGPFMQAAAEEFNKENPDVNITVGQSGTGGGFEKFCKGETDISTASRPIKDEETEACKTGGITTSELVVANDGIAIVGNPSLAAQCMTVDQLSKLWKDDSVADLKELGVDGLSGPVSLYGPGTDSGTFDFFTDVINGEEGVSRKKYQASEDDNILVQGVSSDKTGIGYFGFSYYEQNADKLKLIEVDGGKGCVAPSKETIQDGTYTPLSRELFIYPSAAAVKRPEIKAFLEFINEKSATIAEASLFVPLTDEQLTTAKTELEKIESGV